MALIACPDCDAKISRLAPTCPTCGRPMQAAPVAQPQPPPPAAQKWNPGVAAVLSLVIPGAGQMYKGDVVFGFVWLGMVVVGYLLFIIPGLLLHIVCVSHAASGDPTK